MKTRKKQRLLDSYELENIYNGIYWGTFFFTGFIAFITATGWINGAGHENSTRVGICTTLFILLEWIAGRVIYRYIKDKHRTMILAAAWKLLLFSFSVIMASIITFMDAGVEMGGLVYFAVFSQVAGIVFSIYFIKNPERQTKGKYVNTSIIGGFGALGIVANRILSSGSGHANINLIFIAFNILAGLLNLSIMILLHQYFNYESIYKNKLNS